MARSRNRIGIGGQDSAWNQPLAGLSALRDRLPATAPIPAGDARVEQDGKPDAAAKAGPYSGLRKIVLRRERKGHGGKTVTRVEGLAGSPAELERALREIKRSLGCGAAIEDADILVQGDQAEWLRAFFESRGARKIVLGT